ncbi:hypothetical protein GCM10010124_39000 [Pilimelia terevasa]|uniref:Metalloprotease n=1 Tax=Pilimelia terevasa TaxID=53372 RepID=A0A8J3FLG2_9ACTN|nr:neutral zinc metallopeptidase [Pilimelia terevasa]GGK42336.1 hypothetical protein GCM10010124_39000 [Pilimelia terevasa]
MHARPPVTPVPVDPSPVRRRGRRPAVRLAGAAAAVVLLLAGCALPETPFSRAGAPRTAAPTSTAVPEAGQRLGDGGTSVAEFRQDVEDARSSVEAYWRTALPAQGRRFQPVSRFIGYQGAREVSCAGTPLGLNNAAYCPVGDFIAYDLNWAVGQFRRIGDAFIFYLVGHEYGHAVQQRLGIRHQFTIQQELQADCMAGAWINESVAQKALQLQGGDLDELRRGLLAVADDPDQPWFAPGAHGSARERTDAFFKGFRGELDTCELAGP